MKGRPASRPALAGAGQSKHRNASIREILGLTKRRGDAYVWQKFRVEVRYQTSFDFIVVV